MSLRPLLPRPRARLTPKATPPLRRTLIAAPKPNSGPLMQRRADRALPTVNTSSLRWKLSLPFFGLIIAGATAAIFNYQKQSSSVVESTMYALRTHPAAREALGGEIQFASKIPWIRGTIDQLHGRIDISVGVKGKQGKGTMRFRSERRKRMGYFETLEWSLTTDSGRTIQLLDADGPDPFRRVQEDDED
ncbi:Cytochrome oxidase assembly-1 [Macrophomina phaseolina MS6]|uniref:Cytochrome oxidase assembly-1 n=2 Tax=Macrophomina phaseolina TaxID=35725 RepID=K2SXL8_MACPH|nr:Cytochrome oxidase assembly-1 [Macrophomina phaseolina MS6]KAH7058592.1 cytochrome oxidase complex assembly protein 1-domain-containing protein [Macrophomina phaseolina]